MEFDLGASQSQNQNVGTDCGNSEQSEIWSVRLWMILVRHRNITNDYVQLNHGVLFGKVSRHAWLTALASFPGPLIAGAKGPVDEFGLTSFPGLSTGLDTANTPFAVH